VSGQGFHKSHGIAYSTGGLYYQFITTGYPIATNADGNGFTTYKGSAVSVALHQIKDSSSWVVADLKPKATGSTLESLPTVPPTPPSGEMSLISRVPNVQQTQLIPEPVYRYYEDSSNDKYKQLAYSSASQNGVIYNAGYYMLTPSFNSGDIGYDLPPTTIKGRNTESRMPDTDWPHDACRVTVRTEPFGSRDFIVMVDAHGEFYCWPTEYDNSKSDFLYPSNSPYLSQAIKTNVDSSQVKSVQPILPDWVYAPVGERRDTDWPSTNTGEPRYVWRFHPQGTKVVGSVLSRIEFNEDVYATRGAYRFGIASITPGYLTIMFDKYVPIITSNATMFVIGFQVLPNTRVVIERDEPIVFRGRYGDGGKISAEVDFLYYANASMDVTTPASGMTVLSLTVVDRPSYWNLNTYSRPPFESPSAGSLFFLNEMPTILYGESKINNYYSNPRAGDSLVTIKFDAPGFVEYAITITLTGPERTDFTFSLTELNNQQPDNDHYIINSGYLSPTVGDWSGYDNSSWVGQLLTADLECYYDNDSKEYQTKTNLGYADELEELDRQSILRIKAYESNTILLSFIINYQPLGFKRLQYSVDEATTTYYYKGKLAHLDLSTLSFIYSVEKTVFSLTDEPTGTEFCIEANPNIVISKTKQRWSTKTTGVRVYCFGKVVYESADFDWTAYDLLLDETINPLHRVNYDLVDRRYVGRVGTLGLIKIMAYHSFRSALVARNNNGYYYWDIMDVSSFRSILLSKNYIRSIKQILAKSMGTTLGGFVSQLINPSSYDPLPQEFVDAFNDNMEIEMDLFLSAHLPDYQVSLWEFAIDSAIETMSDCFNKTDGATLATTIANEVSNGFWVSAIYNLKWRIASRYDNFYGMKHGGKIECVRTFVTAADNAQFLACGGAGQLHINNYPIGKEWLFNEWFNAIEDQASRQLSVCPEGYYAIYRKQPVVKNPISDLVLFYKQFNSDSTPIKTSRFIYSTYQYSSFNPYTISYNIDHRPITDDFGYVTIDQIGHCDFSTTTSHNELYKIAFDKQMDTQVNDPSIKINIETYDGAYGRVIGYSGTAERYSETYHKYTILYYNVIDKEQLFFNGYDLVDYPRHNGAMLFSK